jgi:PAS domain-containing protein
VGVAWRSAVLVLCIWILSKAFADPELRAGRVVAGIFAFMALASLWEFIRRTNFLVSRFVESVRFEDYSQRFSDPSGGGFDVLGEALDSALKGLQARHTEQTAEARYLSAIVDDAPSALLSIDEDGRVQMLNKSARQLYSGRSPRRLSDHESLEH